jgi:hypothetical protein
VIDCKEIEYEVFPGVVAKGTIVPESFVGDAVPGYNKMLDRFVDNLRIFKKDGKYLMDITEWFSDTGLDAIEQSILER